MPIAPLDWLSGRPEERIVRRLGSEERSVRQAAYRDLRRVPLAAMSLQENPEEGEDPHASYEIAMIIAGVLERRDDQRTVDDMQTGGLSSAVRTFLSQGRQVFRFDADLAAELAQTDVDDVSLSEIALPYDCFLMELADQGRLADGRAVESILVELRRGAGSRTIHLHPFVREEALATPLPAGMLTIPSSTEETVAETLQKAAEAHKTPLSLDMRGPVTGRPIRDTVSQQEIDAAKNLQLEGNAILRDLLPIVVNGLLYVDNCRTGLRRVWDPNAPQNLVDKAQSDRPGAQKAQQQLAAGGWTKITVCALEQAEGEAGEWDGGGGAKRTEPRAHWRRGHWRRQAHGPGASLRKRIRIRPTKISGAKAGRARDGYAVTD